MKLAQLLPALPHYQLTGDPNVSVNGIESDSRKIQDGMIFVAYPGVTLDGHQFIVAAVQNGANSIVGEWEVSEIRQLLPSEIKIPYIQVPDGREALAWLNAAWHGFPARSMTMIGVTGTDGKTSTVEIIHQILRTAGRKVGMISTVNAVIGDQAIDTGLHTTTPDSPDLQQMLARMRQAGVKICVLEVTSHGLAQHRVTACEFDAAIVTNITHEHLDIHGTLEAYRAAKTSLFSRLAHEHHKPGVPKIAILNREDSSFDYLWPYAAHIKLSYNVGKPGDVTAQNVTHEPDRTRFDINSPQGQISIETALIGDFNVSNILAAAATCLALEIDTDAIREGVASVTGIPGRMERVDRGQPFLALVDFAHTPNSLEQALKAARRLSKNGRLITVFGCAGLRDVEKRPVMGRIAAQLADYAILTAEDPRTEDLDVIIQAIAEGCLQAGAIEGEDFERVPDRSAALARAVELAQAGDIIIACGKGHEQSMCFGHTELPWDDRKALAAALEGHSFVSPQDSRTKP